MKIHVEMNFQKEHESEEIIIIEDFNDHDVFDASMFIDTTTEDHRAKGYIRTWKEISMKCRCGTMVILDAFTNQCHKCGTLYNRSGQTLSNPEEWGWETGELPCECW